MKLAACSARERLLPASATIGSPAVDSTRPSACATAPVPTIATLDWHIIDRLSDNLPTTLPTTLAPGPPEREDTRPSMRLRGIIRTHDISEFCTSLGGAADAGRCGSGR